MNHAHGMTDWWVVFNQELTETDQAPDLKVIHLIVEAVAWPASIPAVATLPNLSHVENPGRCLLLTTKIVLHWRRPTAMYLPPQCESDKRDIEQKKRTPRPRRHSIWLPSMLPRPRCLQQHLHRHWLRRTHHLQSCTHHLSHHHCLPLHRCQSETEEEVGPAT